MNKKKTTLRIIINQVFEKELGFSASALIPWIHVDLRLILDPYLNAGGRDSGF